MIHLKQKSSFQKTAFRLCAGLLLVNLLVTLSPAYADNSGEPQPTRPFLQAVDLSRETGLNISVTEEAQWLVRNYYSDHFLRNEKKMLNDLKGFLKTAVDYCDQEAFRRANDRLSSHAQDLRALFNRWTSDYSRINEKYNEMHARFEQAANRPLLISGVNAAAGGAAVKIFHKVLGMRSCPPADAAFSFGALVNLAGATYDLAVMLSSKDEILELLRLKLEYERHLLPEVRLLIADAEQSQQHFAGLFSPTACESVQCVQESESERSNREAREERERQSYLRQREREIEADRHRMQERQQQNNEIW